MTMLEQQALQRVDSLVSGGTARHLIRTRGGSWVSMTTTVGTQGITRSGPGVIQRHRAHAGNTVTFLFVVRWLYS